MNARERYIADLASHLSPLTDVERQDALEFYDEFIADGDLTSRQAIEGKLGTPRQLSRQILADPLCRDQYAFHGSDDRSLLRWDWFGGNRWLHGLPAAALLVSPPAGSGGR